MSYNASSISKLDTRTALRTRGSTYYGERSIETIYHMTQEVISNVIDEKLMGYGNKCKVEILKDNSIRITDEARGIPIGRTKDGDEAMRVSFMEIHGGGKLGAEGQEAYNSSGGLNGIGLKIATYTSKFCIGISKREGKIHEIRFEDGKLAQPTIQIGTTKETGTTVHFLPDETLFGSNDIDPNRVYSMLKNLSYLVQGFVFEISDERKPEWVKPRVICSKSGLVDYVNDLRGDDDAVCKPIIGTGDEGDCHLDFVLQYADTTETTMKLFTNNIPNPSGGTHKTGWSTAFTTAINKYAREKKLLKDTDSNFTGADLQEGMILVLNIRMPEPQFDGQTKTELKDPRGRTTCSRITKEIIEIWLGKNPKEAKAIITKILLTQRALAAAKKAKEKITATPTDRKNIKAVLGDKLTDCKSTDPRKTELYIAEGDSAAGTIAGARNAIYQAVLGLRGKTMNTEKETDMSKILNEKGALKDLVAALGASIDGPATKFDIKKMRYGKLIICADGDVDGSHIQVLLITFIWRYMRDIINEGRLYVAQPPLYELIKGNKVQYCYNSQELQNMDTKGWEVRRLKGLVA